MYDLSLAEARALLLAAQGLDRAATKRATKESVLAVIRRMGVLQIDTIHVVARSPYLVLWSRLGAYDPVWLDEQLAEGRIFEYWAHEASFLPIEDYPLFRRRMRETSSLGWKYSHDWMTENRATVRKIRAHLRAHGPVRAADFTRADGKGGGWWGWKPEKRALEYLFSAGELMIARREHFQRVYDLRERVLPGWNAARLPSTAATHRALVANAVRAIGVATARWAADYYRMSLAETSAAIKSLVRDGELLPARIESVADDAFLHRDHSPTLAAIRRGRRPSHTTILSPFDPVVWDRKRALALFGFDYRIECYMPAPKRRYGYFTLPILVGDRLVGRLDAKAHRTDGVFEVISLHVEKTIALDDALAEKIAGAIHACADWHGTPRVRLRRVVAREAQAVLRRALIH
jgi:uncharacterized protein YcaQ